MNSQTSGNTFSQVSAIVIAICTAPVFFFFRIDQGRATAAWGFAIAIVMSALIFWGRRRQLWFWMTLAILTVLHALLVLYIRWPVIHGVGGGRLTPFGLVDIGIVCGLLKLVDLKLVEKLTTRSNRASSPV